MCIFTKVNENMPLTYVLKINVPSDQTLQQHKEHLEKRLISLKPRKLNKFHVQAIVFQSSNQNSINQFLHSDYPATCFSIVEPSSGNNPEVKVLTGDIGLSSIQRRICELGILTERKASQMECIGSGFKIDDFQVKIGIVTQNSSNKGLLIEISYSSANNNQDGYGLILEFINNYFNWSITNDLLPNHVRRRSSQSFYTPEDIIIQYHEHFNNFRSLNS
jgi:hypothetical protein